MPTQREAEPDGRKPYYVVQAYIEPSGRWCNLKTYKQEWRARKERAQEWLSKRRIVRVHPDGKTEVVG